MEGNYIRTSLRKTKVQLLPAFLVYFSTYIYIYIYIIITIVIIPVICLALIPLTNMLDKQGAGYEVKKKIKSTIYSVWMT